MRRLIASLMTTVVLLVIAGPVRAGIVYDNGPINGTISAYNVSNYTTTDSFTISAATNLVQAAVGLWVDPGASPTSIDWSIGTSAFGSDVSSGTSTPSNTFFGLGFGLYYIYESVFSISGTVAPGTYWLTLTNTGTTDGNAAYWDE